MKRLLCVLSGMNAGGAETFLIKIYRKLDKSIYQMDFCVNDFEAGYYDNEIFKMGGKIYRIPSKSDNLMEFKKQLSDIIKKGKYKNVLRITSNSMGFMDLKIAKKAGAKVCAARSSNSNDPSGIKERIAHKLGKILYSRYVDVKIAPSDLAAKYTFGKKNYEKGKVKIIHNAVDLEFYRFSLEARTNIRKELGIGDEEVLCGHIGRFSEQKNHVFLIDIFSEICKERSNYKLLLVGKGELAEIIKEKCVKLGINDKVIFLGVRSDIPALLSAMDVFVFPSLYEGMPNTVIEAQATGLPCVISDSITKEANITGLVSYCSLENGIKEWTEGIYSAASKARSDTYQLFLEQKYNIESTVEEFVNSVIET